MESAKKLKISILGNEKIFEIGENNVESIYINKNKGIIEIEFGEGSNWDSEIIPIQSLESINYKKSPPDYSKMVESNEY